MEVRYVSGVTHYNTPGLRDECAVQNRQVVTTRRGAMEELKCGESFISRGHSSMAYSKTSLNGAVRWQSKG